MREYVENLDLSLWTIEQIERAIKRLKLIREYKELVEVETFMCRVCAARYPYLSKHKE